MRFKTLLLAALLGTLTLGAAVRVRAQSAAETPPAAGQVAGPATAASPSNATPMLKADALALLYKIYDRAYHFSDAVSKLPAADWKFGGRKRQVFYEKAAVVRSGVTDLRKPWDDFYKQPDDAALGRATLTAVQSVVTQANDFVTALEDTPGSAQAPDFKSIATDLGDLEHQLEPYVTYLQASPRPAPSAPTASAAPAQPAPAPSVTPPTAVGNNPPEHAAASPLPTAETPATPPAQPGAETSAPASASAPGASTPPSPTPPSPAQPAASPGAAQPAVTPVAMQPADVQAILYKIYMATFRIGDLAGSLQLDKWNMAGPDQAAFVAKVDALRAALAAAEKSRGDFYNHPEDADLGRSVSSDLQAVTPKLDDLIAALDGTPGAASASEFKQGEGDLAGLDQRLDPYVAYLAEKAQPPAANAGAEAIETEVVKIPEAAAPLSTLAVEKAPEDQEQVKTMLYKAYVPAFRLKDMLAQEHPDQWRATQTERTAFEDASKTLSERIADLEKWRDQLANHPESLEAAFEAYASLGKLVGPADVVGRLVGQYGDPKIGAEYGQRAEQVEASRDELEPYLDYLLGHHDHTVGMIERNFMTCESQLTYSMRPTVQQAVSMKNVNPVFRGRGKRTERGGHQADTSKKKGSAHEKKSPAAPAPGR
jgi:hypothetical protein